MGTRSAHADVPDAARDLKKEALASYREPPPFPVSLRILLKRLQAGVAEIITLLKHTHNQKDTTGNLPSAVQVFQIGTGLLAHYFLAIARLSPVPEVEIRQALYLSGCTLINMADRCRYPQLRQRLDGTVQGYYATTGCLARALAHAQGDVPMISERPERRVSILSLRLTEMLDTPPERRRHSPGEWRPAFDSLVRIGVDLTLARRQGDLRRTKVVYLKALSNFRRTLAARWDSLEPLMRWEYAQASSWADSVEIQFAAYASTAAGVGPARHIEMLDELQESLQLADGLSVPISKRTELLLIPFGIRARGRS